MEKKEALEIFETTMKELTNCKTIAQMVGNLEFLKAKIIEKY